MSLSLALGVTRFSRSAGTELGIPSPQRFIPEAQLAPFYAAISAYRSRYLHDPWAYRDLIRLMLYTGIRFGEATHLRWDNVDLGAGVIQLSAAQTKANRKLDLPMSDYVRQLLRERLSIRTATGNAANQWVFPGESGPVSDPRNALMAAARYVSAASGTTDATAFYYNPHSLRRTFVTVAESCDLSTYTLKALVNHSFGDDVTAIYVGRDIERLRTGAQKVANRMFALCSATETISRQSAVA
jgi:integrase